MNNSDFFSSLPFPMGEVVPEQKPDFKKMLDDAIEAKSRCDGPRQVDTQVRVIFEEEVTVPRIVCGLKVQKPSTPSSPNIQA